MPPSREDQIVPPSQDSGGKSVSRFFGATGRFIFEVAKVVMVALVIIIPIRIFVFQPFQVNGSSMDPSFLDRDYLIVDEITYRFREPERGEVIVFRFPRDRSQFFIKRIIGLPGETIRVEGNEISITNGEEMILDESSYLINEGMINASISQEVVLGDDEYYVLGDNRDASSDSRSWGPIQRSDIIGTARYRAFPFDRAESIPKPTY